MNGALKTGRNKQYDRQHIDTHGIIGRSIHVESIIGLAAMIKTFYPAIFLI